MSKVPSAWDDDWEAAADKGEVAASEPAQPPPKLTKAQRRAQHAEQQRQLWDSAENPARFHWLEAQGVVPLKQEFKTPMVLLSRKPNPPAIAKKEDGANGAAGDDDEDSETESRRKREAELEERTRKAKLEREEKQRKYAEARERIMGSSTPTQNMPGSRESSHGRENRRSRGKMNGRGGGSSGPASADQSPARPGSSTAGLYDPDDLGRRIAKKETAQREGEPIRQPMGPESGRGGFGFAGRGGRAET